MEPAITRYPYDPRRSEQLLAEVGYPTGSDGTFVTGGERFAPVFWEESGSQNEKVLNVFLALFRPAWFDMQPFVLITAQLRDAQLRAGYPAM